MSDPSLYDSYVAFKNWDGPAVIQSPENFACLLQGAGARGRSLEILDYGFGDGTFLDWAKAAGHSVTGVEILPAMVRAATARGHTAFLADQANGWLGERRFDVIVLLDVMEHLDAAGFRSLMALARQALKPEGRILARFPNGDSPFFGRYHHGDLTHERPLSSGALDQRARPEGMAVAHVFNLRPIPHGLVRSIKQRLAYVVRDIVEAVLGFAYFGYRFPMDPNVAVVLMRTEEARLERADQTG